jgi:hypothetical protein
LGAFGLRIIVAVDCIEAAHNIGDEVGVLHIRAIVEDRDGDCWIAKGDVPGFFHVYAPRTPVGP